MAISEDLIQLMQNLHVQSLINYLSQSKEMSLNDVASLNVKQNEVGRKKAMISRAPIIAKMQSSSYQGNMYREFGPIDNAFLLLNMLPLHHATNTMYSSKAVATPETIQPPYSISLKSIHIATKK